MIGRRILLAFGIILPAASVITCVVHLRLFQDLHHIFIFLAGEIAFVPIEVLLERRAIAERRDRMGMLFGAFFSTVGIDLSAILSRADPDLDRVHLGVDADRVYPMLTSEWLVYLQSVGRLSPYLYSPALRTSPFDPGTTVIVQGSGLRTPIIEEQTAPGIIRSGRVCMEDDQSPVHGGLSSRPALSPLLVRSM